MSRTGPSGAVIPRSSSTAWGVPPSRSRTALLWTLALLLMAATVVYQRRTGPTHPLRGTVSLNGGMYYTS